MIVLQLDARRAHVVAQLHLAAFADGFQTLVGDGARVPHHVRGERAVGVVAHVALLDLDLRERVGVLGDEGDVAKPHVARHDALALRAGRRILDALAHHVVRHSEHRGQALHHVAVVGHLRIGHHGQRHAVLHERNAVDVADVAARRGRGDGGVLVVVRFAAIRLGRQHLHGPQLRRQRAEDARRQHAHGDEPRLEVVGRVGRRTLRRARVRLHGSVDATARVSEARFHAHRAD